MLLAWRIHQTISAICASPSISIKHTLHDARALDKHLASIGNDACVRLRCVCVCVSIRVYSPRWAKLSEPRVAWSSAAAALKTKGISGNRGT